MPSGRPATATASAYLVHGGARAPAPGSSTPSPSRTSPHRPRHRRREWILHAATRTSRAWRRSACARTSSSTPSSPDACSGSPVSASQPSSSTTRAVAGQGALAVDWSTRPLPEPWLRYAALDVEVLVELRNLMGVDLARQGKAGWAREEFEALLDFTGPTQRVDPWRRTSGMHRVRQRRGAAIVRELWETRDAIALDRDVSPGRVLPDAVLVEIAMAAPKSPADLPKGHRSIARYQRQWLDAVRRAQALPEAELAAADPGPDRRRSARGDRDPVAAERLATARRLTPSPKNTPSRSRTSSRLDPLRR